MSRHSRFAVSFLTKYTGRLPPQIDQELSKIDELLGGQRIPVLTQNQWDAVSCWLHSVLSEGANDAAGTKWTDSALMKFLKAKKLQLVAGELDQWVYRNGRASKDLIFRRSDEMKIFLEK